MLAPFIRGAKRSGAPAAPTGISHVPQRRCRGVPALQQQVTKARHGSPPQSALVAQRMPQPHWQ
jgi:hypothetical protein